MKNCIQSSDTAIYRAIYIEEQAQSYEITKNILRRFPGIPVISVRNYKDIFNRPHQNQEWQKKKPALILAKKEPPFFYEGPTICQNFGCSRFYYTSVFLNCRFNCAYCYLQGMYPSGDIVLFVNCDDFSSHLLRLLEEAPDEKLYIAASYDTDLLSFQSTYPYMDYFYSKLQEFSAYATQEKLVFEIRTKSASTRFFLENPPLPSLVFAFSIAPEEVISRYEKNTPSLKARLTAISTAQDAGHLVRLCFDPIFADDDFLTYYDSFFSTVFDAIDSTKVIDISYGFFRMNKDFFNRIAKNKPMSTLFLQEFEKKEMISYDKKKRESVTARHLEILTRYIARDKIFVLEE